VTREEWLLAMTEELRPLFAAAAAPLPEKLRVSCGWPSNRGLASPGSTSRTIGQCWPTDFSADGTPEVFVSPYVADAVDVAAVLVHELIHVFDNCRNGHKAPFRRIALAVGLAGRMTATHAGPELAAHLNALCSKVGPYPHASLDRSQVKKQGTRMLKVECPDCGYTVRTTAKWIEEGLPTCPCGTEMEHMTE
jgi:hypothetical protein